MIDQSVGIGENSLAEGDRTGDAVTDRHALLKGKSDSPAATFFPQRQKCIALTVDFLHAVKGAATKPDFVKGAGIAIMKFKELACKL